jgi:predicted nucleic acid-binding protein
MPDRRNPPPGRRWVLFLDANVLFSAAYSSEGRSAALFALARKRLCRLTTSQYALEEARRNLSGKKPGALTVLSALMAWVKTHPEATPQQMEPASTVGIKDEMDVPILAAAIGHADILVTGDRKHFGPWMGKTLHGVKVLSLSETLGLILAG